MELNNQTNNNKNTSSLKRRGRLQGVYGPKTRSLQRRLEFEAFGLSFKTANIWLYLGSRENTDPNIFDISSPFMEVPDRAYSAHPIEIPIGMELEQENKTDFSRFGLINPLGDEIRIRVHIDDLHELGRAMIVGDVIEVPFYHRNDKKFYLEITDVDDSQEVEKFIHIVHATKLGDQRTTSEIPVDNSNADVMDLFGEQLNDMAQEQVPVKGTTFEEEPEKEDIDYRRSNQSSFLDDPNKSL